MAISQLLLSHFLLVTHLSTLATLRKYAVMDRPRHSHTHKLTHRNSPETVWGSSLLHCLISGWTSHEINLHQMELASLFHKIFQISQLHFSTHSGQDLTRTSQRHNCAIGGGGGRGEVSLIIRR